MKRALKITDKKYKISEEYTKERNWGLHGWPQRYSKK